MASYKIDFRIGANFSLPPPDPAAGDFIPVIHRGLPAPDRWTFTPYTQTRVRGDGRSVGDGYPSASWTWEVLNQQQLDNLLRFFSNDADASVAIYIRTPVERGLRVGTADYTAIMHRPLAGDTKTMIPESTNPVWEEITIQFTRLVPR